MDGGWGAMVTALGTFLTTHTVIETLLYLNSDARVARDVGLYYELARFGEPGDYAGPDLLAEWYRRNIRIYNNVMKLVESPKDRILVIFGYGHLGWLRQDFAANPSLRLRRLEEFVPAAQKEGAEQHSRPYAGDAGGAGRSISAGPLIGKSFFAEISRRGECLQPHA